MNDTMSRFLRTLIQVLAAGGFTKLFDALTGQVDVQYQAIVGSFFLLLVVLAQNWLEDTGRIPALLGKKKVVDGTSGPTVL